MVIEKDIAVRVNTGLHASLTQTVWAPSSTILPRTTNVASSKAANEATSAGAITTGSRSGVTRPVVSGITDSIGVPSVDGGKTASST